MVVETIGMKECDIFFWLEAQKDKFSAAEMLLISNLFATGFFLMRHYEEVALKSEQLKAEDTRDKNSEVRKV